MGDKAQSVVCPGPTFDNGWWLILLQALGLSAYVVGALGLSKARLDLAWALSGGRVSGGILSIEIAFDGAVAGYAWIGNEGLGFWGGSAYPLRATISLRSYPMEGAWEEGASWVWM